jgi:hypothetical protein
MPTDLFIFVCFSAKHGQLRFLSWVKLGPRLGFIAPIMPATSSSSSQLGVARSPLQRAAKVPFIEKGQPPPTTRTT